MNPLLSWGIAPGRQIGDGHPCFIIAEIGSNHDHKYEQALRLIDAAAEAGVDAVKVQTFRAAQHYSNRAPGFTYLGGRNTFELIRSLEIDRAWHAPLQAYCASRNLIFLSSPCDAAAVDELHALGMPAFKVASFDITDLELIGHMARTGRAVLLSTGLADWMDIQRAVDACTATWNSRVALLQCTSLYPAPVAMANLKAISVMRVAFGVVTWYSDHTDGDHVILAAVALGASIIEKHVTLSRSLPGPDHPFAMEPPELARMVRKVRDVEAAMGDGRKTGPRTEELEMAEKGRRSLHASRRIAAGEVITADMLTTKRPGLGISPHLAHVVLGRVARVDIDADQWITWDMI